MKKILLITTACLTLNACETVDTISWPTMPSLDLFSDTQPVENISTQNTPAPTLNRATIDTELSEMEKLTGYAPRFDNTASKSKIVDVADAPVKEVIEEAIKPAEKATVTQPIEITKAITTEPIIKPTVPKQPKPQTIVKDIKEDTQSTTTKTEKEIAKTVAEKIEPIQEVIQPKKMTKIVEPVMKAVEVVQPKIQTPTQTIETPMFTEADLKLSSATGCPQIEIMPSARSMTYFENELSGNLLARAVINEIRGGCEITSNGMELDIDILMNGRITNKGRFEGNKDQEAFMTFPYFVSVLTPQGLPVDKKNHGNRNAIPPIR